MGHEGVAPTALVAAAGHGMQAPDEGRVELRMQALREEVMPWQSVKDSRLLREHVIRNRMDRVEEDVVHSAVYERAADCDEVHRRALLRVRVSLAAGEYARHTFPVGEEVDSHQALLGLVRRG